MKRKNKEEVQFIEENIEYRNALIALFAIVGVFVITQGIVSKDFASIISSISSSGTASKIIDNLVFILIYVVSLLASITGIILLLIYSIKSIKRSKKKYFGRIGLGVSILGILGIAIPVILVLTKL